jgi:glyoxylase-like metal-dependent hydrolase (beta-lactamase superfamily II)
MFTELRDGVWWLECTGVNAYLLEDDDGLTLVDAGTPFDAAKIEACVTEAGFDVGEIERILVTHYDFDHVGSAPKLSVEVPVHVGRADVDYATGQRRPRLRGPKPLIQLLSGLLVPDLPEGRVRPVDDGDAVGGFTAHHAPGHTPGHTVYVHEDRQAAFLGDLVVERGGSLRPSPWVLSYDTDAVRRSVRDVATGAGDFEVAAMGHGTPFCERGSDRLREVAGTL